MAARTIAANGNRTFIFSPSLGNTSSRRRRTYEIDWCAHSLTAALRLHISPGWGQKEGNTFLCHFAHSPIEGICRATTPAQADHHGAEKSRGTPRNEALTG